MFRDDGATTQRLEGRDSLWVYRGQLMEVVGVPLLFGTNDSEPAARADGALIMAAPLDDELATTLARSQGCQITFMTDGQAQASSLTSNTRAAVIDAYQRASWPRTEAFDLRFDGINYRSSLDPLVDPATGTNVGSMLIQCSLADAESVQHKISQSILGIMISGLIMAVVLSFALSSAVTRPVQELVGAAKRVAAGELDGSLKVTRKDELGELATAFNEMVSGLRRQRELKLLVEESQAANKAKSLFLANMSHEIRTPLHGVIGMSDLLLRTELTAPQRRYAGLVKSSAEVLTTLINDILDFSKIEAGKLELEALDFDLHRLIQDVVELMRQRAEGKGLRIDFEIDPLVPSAMNGDPTRLRQILLNLVNNAIKFTGAGKVAVHVTLDGAWSDGLTSLKFEVRDSGVGIPADRLDRLFKSFSQVDASTTRRFGGTGLGLAICKQLVELMGGAIGVQSDIGAGSTFWFTVGLKQPRSAAPSEAQTAQPAISTGHRGARILLAEDNEVNQIVAAELLRSAGYQCDIASNGTEALAAAIEHNYDLILMDCQMPEMDGLEATRRIRQRETPQSGRRVPIIALTANASGVVRERCEEAGMDAYCSKPFEPDDLLRKIESFLNESGVNPALPRIAESSEPESPGPVKSAPDDSPPFDLSALLRRCSGKTSLAITILEKFEKQVAAAVSDMQRLLETSQVEPLARASHALKGTAGVVAAESLRRAAGALEEFARAGAMADSSDSLERVKEEVDRCLAGVASARERLSSAGALPAGGAPCAS